MVKLSVILVFFIFITYTKPLRPHFSEGEDILALTYYNSEQGWIMKIVDNFTEKDNWIAKAHYFRGLHKNGWDELSISTNSIYTDYTQAEAAGRLEGYLTMDRIYDHYINLNSSNGNITDEVRNFLRKHEEWIIDSFNKNPNDSIIYNAYLILRQFKGLREQYDIEQNDTDKKINEMDFYTMAADFDLEGIKYKFNPPKFKEMSKEELEDYILLNSHCSVILKTKYDLSDVFFGHNTWTQYTFLVKIFKEYNFNFNNPCVKAKTVMFCSYPATLTSNDDFFVTNKNLAILETTNPFLNEELYQTVKPESLLTCERTMISSRVSSTAKEWTKSFTNYFSGTFINMYMVLDMNKLDLDKGIINDEALVIVEEVPTLCAINDLTETLRYGYFPSYNIPYDAEIRKISKVLEYEDKLPKNKFDYDNNNRAKIMRRDEHNITDIEKMKDFFNYNNYQHEPFSGGQADETLAARSDLRSPRPLCFGAQDAKVGSAKEFLKEKKIHIFGGPTHKEVPPFDWDASGEICSQYKRLGLPSLFNYSWIEFKNYFDC